MSGRGFVPEQKIDEIWCARKGGDAAYRQFGRRRDGARQGVGHQQKECSEEDGVGEQMAVAAPKQQTDDVRHDKSDEPDDTAKGDHNPDQEGSHNQHYVGGALRVYTDAFCRFNSHLHDIQIFGMVIQNKECNNHNGYQPSDFTPGNRGQTAHGPEIDFLHGLLVYHDEQGDDGGDEEIERDACEQEGLGGAVAREASDAHDED